MADPRFESREILAFPQTPPITQYAQGMVQGLPWRMAQQQRADQLRQQGFQNRMAVYNAQMQQQQMAAQIAQIDEKKLQQMADGISGIIPKLSPEAAQSVINNIEKTSPRLAARIPYTQVPRADRGAMIRQKSPFPGWVPPGMEGKYGQAKTKSEITDVLEEPTPTEKSKTKAEAADYKNRLEYAESIARDDSQTVEDRTAAIEAQGLNDGDKKRLISVAQTTTAKPKEINHYDAYKTFSNRAATETDAAKKKDLEDRAAYHLAEFDKLQGYKQEPPPGEPPPQAAPAPREQPQPTAERTRTGATGSWREYEVGDQITIMANRVWWPDKEIQGTVTGRGNDGLTVKDNRTGKEHYVPSDPEGWTYPNYIKEGSRPPQQKIPAQAQPPSGPPMDITKAPTQKSNEETSDRDKQIETFKQQVKAEHPDDYRVLEQAVNKGTITWTQIYEQSVIMSK